MSLGIEKEVTQAAAGYGADTNDLVQVVDARTLAESPTKRAYIYQFAAVISKCMRRSQVAGTGWEARAC